jgi:hypothetical protein
MKLMVVLLNLFGNLAMFGAPAVHTLTNKGPLVLPSCLQGKCGLFAAGYASAFSTFEYHAILPNKNVSLSQ